MAITVSDKSQKGENNARMQRKLNEMQAWALSFYMWPMLRAINHRPPDGSDPHVLDMAPIYQEAYAQLSYLRDNSRLVATKQVKLLSSYPLHVYSARADRESSFTRGVAGCAGKGTNLLLKWTLTMLAATLNRSGSLQRQPPRLSKIWRLSLSAATLIQSGRRHSQPPQSHMVCGPRFQARFPVVSPDRHSDPK